MRRRAECVEIEAIRDDVQLGGGHALALEVPRRCLRVGDDRVGAPECCALHGQLGGRAIGIETPAAPNAHFHAGKRGSRKRKDVRVEVGRVNDLYTVSSAPACKGKRLATRLRPPEATDRERGDWCCGDRFRMPRPLGVKAGQADIPAFAIESPHEFDHLALGASGVEAGHHDGDWDLRRTRHGLQLRNLAAILARR